VLNLCAAIDQEGYQTGSIVLKEAGRIFRGGRRGEGERRDTLGSCLRRRSWTRGWLKRPLTRLGFRRRSLAWKPWHPLHPGGAKSRLVPGEITDIRRSEILPDRQISFPQRAFRICGGRREFRTCPPGVSRRHGECRIYSKSYLQQRKINPAQDLSRHGKQPSLWGWLPIVRHPLPKLSRKSLTDRLNPIIRYSCTRDRIKLGCENTPGQHKKKLGWDNDLRPSNCRWGGRPVAASASRRRFSPHSARSSLPKMQARAQDGDRLRSLGGK